MNGLRHSQINENTEVEREFYRTYLEVDVSWKEKEDAKDTLVVPIDRDHRARPCSKEKNTVWRPSRSVRKVRSTLPNEPRENERHNKCGDSRARGEFLR